MASDGQFKIDQAGFGEHVLRADWLKTHLVEMAERAQAVAESIAPVDETGPHPGRYKESFSVESGETDVYSADWPGAGPRVYAELVNSSPEALLVEFGSKNNPKHRVLGKATGVVR